MSPTCPSDLKEHKMAKDKPGREAKKPKKAKAPKAPAGGSVPPPLVKPIKPAGS